MQPPYNDITVMYGLGSAGQAAVTISVGTILNDNPLVRAIFRRHIRPRTLAALCAPFGRLRKAGPGPLRDDEALYNILKDLPGDFAPRHKKEAPGEGKR